MRGECMLLTLLMCHVRFWCSAACQQSPAGSLPSLCSIPSERVDNAAPCCMVDACCELGARNDRTPGRSYETAGAM